MSDHNAVKLDPREGHYWIPSHHDGLSLFLRHLGERQKVGGPVSSALGRTARRIPRKINRLKGTVADLPRL